MPIDVTSLGRDSDKTCDKLWAAATRAYAEQDFGAVTFSGISTAAGFTPPVAKTNFKRPIEAVFAEVFTTASVAETVAIGQCFSAAAAAIAEFSDDVAQERFQEAADGLIAFYRVPCRIRSNASAYRHFYTVIQEAYFEAFYRRLAAALQAAPAFHSWADPERPGLLAAIEAKAQFIAAPFALIALDDERQKLAAMLRNAVADERDYVTPDRADDEPVDCDEAVIDIEPGEQEVIDEEITF